ncbi:coth protein-domain-containing protein [Chlamydoabsidia padenii]|nr:coth protein-domain-containing protein [Chlamydoabsidia padenii]
MMLYQKIIVSLLLLFVVHVLTATNATEETYKVIALPKDRPVTDIGVQIDNNQFYRMEPVAPGSVLYQIKAPKATSGYKYIHINRATNKIEESEPFERSPLDNEKDEKKKKKKKEEKEPKVEGVLNGLNEFYGRNWTFKDVKAFAPIEAFPQGYDRSPAPDLHPQNEIPTMHIQAPASDIEKLHGYYLQDVDYKVNITYITSKKVIQFVDSKLKLSGRSTRYYTKFAYGISLPKHNNIDGYRKLKLRACGADPTYIREKLAYDMLSAAGRPGSRNSYVRLFINDRAFGLFFLVEKYDDNWMRHEFGAGDKTYDNGILYQGQGAQKGSHHAADLSYHGDDQNYYKTSAYDIAEKPSQGNATFDALIGLTKFIDTQLTLQNNKTADLNHTMAEWNQRIDVNGFCINMAMDFLLGNFDAYAQNTNNYFLYQNPDQHNRFVFLNWDMDMSFGDGPVHHKSNIKGDYRQFKGFDIRPLTKATFINGPFRSVFESQLGIVVRRLFHPDISFPVIDSLIQLLEQDIAWDKSLAHARKGANFFPFGPHLIANWFHNNSTGETVSLPLTTDFLVAADFVIRINVDMPLQRALDGPTRHSSLYALKVWIKEKTANVMPFIDSYNK